jgi:hypothetical protein
LYEIFQAIEALRKLMGAANALERLRSLPALLATLAGLVVSVLLWNSANAVLQLLGFVVFQVVGSVGLAIFADQPLAWLTYAANSSPHCS